MKAQITRRFSMVVAPAAATLLLSLLPCHAQAPGPYPGAAPPQATLRGGIGPINANGGGPNFMPPGQFPTQQPYPNSGQFAFGQPNQQPTLPNGVSKIYANEGNNQLLVMATPEGYEAVRELVRNLTGQLDIVQTKVVAVEVTPADLKSLGIALKPNEDSVSTTDAATLLAALQTGTLQPTETLRITTREGMPIDTLLRQRGRRLAAGGTPFTLVTREEQDGSLTMQIVKPASVQATVKSGQTAVVALPGSTSDSVELLFLTPALLPSNVRSAR